MRRLAALLLLAPLLSGCLGGEPQVNLPPMARFSILAGDAPTRFILDASATTDPERRLVSYGWNWVLGSAVTQEPRHEIELPAAAVEGNARHYVTLVVRDDAGQADFALELIQLGRGENHPPEIKVADAARWVKPGAEVVLDANRSMDPEGDPFAVEWIWGPRADFVEQPEAAPDPCAVSDTRAATFTTGCLAEGQSFDHTFDGAGTFELHCHPHPWMRSRLVVDASLPAGAEPVVLDIANFALESLTVGAGTTVRFVNRDPVPHTATVEAWVPGTTSGGSDLVLRLKPEAGEYVIRLVLTDAKGNLATQTWGIRVSDDAPEILGETFTGLARVPKQDTVDAEDYEFEAKWLTRFEASFAWTDPSAAIHGNASLGALVDGSWTELGSCNGRPSVQASRVVIACWIGPGGYSLRARSDQGVVADGTLTYMATPYAAPGFGDSAPVHHH